MFSKLSRFITGRIIGVSATLSVVGITSNTLSKHEPESASLNNVPQPAPPSKTITSSAFKPRYVQFTPEEQLLEEAAPIALAPQVPPPITRKEQRRLTLELSASRKVMTINGDEKFEFWPFDGSVPGPLIRARVGDVLDVKLHNRDETGMEHNVDFHAATAPGGGALALNTQKGETTHAKFRLCYPGFFLYHCSVAPPGVHIGRAMYGAMIVEPEEGLPPVDKEFYVAQMEIYAEQRKSSQERKEMLANGEDPDLLDFDYEAAMQERPRFVVYNGKVGALQDERMLRVKKNDRVRLYFVNAGPNLTSAMHVIGATFDHVYRDGSFLNKPTRGHQAIAVPPGNTAVIEMDMPVPGKYTLIDHSIFRVEKGCAGFIQVEGEAEPRLYEPYNEERACVGCKLH